MFKRAILATSLLCGLAGLAGCGSAHHTAYITTPLNSSVSAFRVDNQSGKFTEIPGSPYQAGISPATIVVHPNHKFAYVTNGGGNDISLFKISGDFALTEVLPRTPAGTNPSSAALDAAGKFLYVCNSGFQGQQLSNTVSVYSVDASSGALSPVGTVNVGYNPVFLTLSPSGKFLYVANAAGGTLSAFTVDSAGGLTQIAGSPYPLSTGGTQGAGPNGIAIDPGEHYLFVANLLASTVGGYAIDPNTGALSPLNGQPYTAGTAPASLAFDKTGSYLYVANLTSNNVTAFAIGTNGVPKQIDGSPYAGGTQPAFIQLDPSGEFVFVGTEGAGGRQILSYKINPSSGQLASQAASGLASTPTSLVLLK